MTEQIDGMTAENEKLQAANNELQRHRDNLEDDKEDLEREKERLTKEVARTQQVRKEGNGWTKMNSLNARYDDKNATRKLFYSDLTN